MPKEKIPEEKKASTVYFTVNEKNEISVRLKELKIKKSFSEFVRDATLNALKKSKK